MSVRWIMGLGFIWILGMILCQTLEGAFFSATDADVLNAMGSFRNVEAGGLTAIPLLTTNWFDGFVQVITWDYSFLEGGFGLVKIFMYGISLGVIWGIIQTFAPAATGILGNLLRLGQ
ncbi:MAG: hypothetical protein PHQ43_09200 [Dehalococcoidales bacterium]|nr:hypothetical protein [Dehalococcoidales bacterium]